MTAKHAMRDALIESRRIVADALKAFGECDHSVGICNCDMKRSIAASDAALAAYDDELERDAARTLALRHKKGKE